MYTKINLSKIKVNKILRMGLKLYNKLKQYLLFIIDFIIYQKYVFKK